MPALGVGEHRQHVLARLAVALPNQEISLLPQELLRFRTGNRPMVPLLLSQGLLTGGDHIEELGKDTQQLDFSSPVLELQVMF